jgi:hypothetical protein
VIPLPARTVPARVARLTVGAAAALVRRPSGPAGPPVDRVGWLEQQRRTERWFVRRGLPSFAHRYSTPQGVWTRAFPALVVLFAVQVLGLVNVTGHAGDDRGLQDDGLLEVVLTAVGFVVLLVTWVGLNLRRGRRPFARPPRLGALELAAFVLVPVLPAILRRQVGDVLATVLGNLALLGVVYLVTTSGLVPLTRGVLGRLPRQTAMIGGLLARALPMLLIVGLLFFTSGPWQSVGSGTGAGYLVAVCLLAGLALAVLATTLALELPGLGPFASWDEVAELVPGTPAEHLVPASSTVPEVPSPSRRQRFDAAVVRFVTQAVQVALVSLLLGVFLLILGVCAMPAAVHAWTGAPPSVVDLAPGPLVLPVTEPMLRVVGFLTAFTSLYFSVASLTDATYRRQLLEDTASQLRCAFAVRAVYLTRVVPAARGDVAAEEPALAPVTPVAAGLTRRALRQSGRLRPVPPRAGAPDMDERREVS